MTMAIQTLPTKTIPLKNIHPQKSNIDTTNDGLENVSAFKLGYFGYSIYADFRGGVKN